MRKKVISSLFFFCSLISFSSCNSKENHKILSCYHDNIDSFIYVDENELQDLHKTNEDFILFVYSDCGCGGHTDDVIKAFQEYIKNYKQIIYAIGEDDYLKLPISLDKYFPKYPSSIKETSKIMPSLYFYNDGELINKVTYSEKFKKTNEIKKILNKYSTSNGIWYLNDLVEISHKDVLFYKFDLQTTILLDNSITNNISVLFTWKSCSDCLSFKTYLNDLYQEFEKKLYVFEVDYFRNSSNKQAFWDEKGGFPDKYQFSSYRGGKVPVIVTYSNGEKQSMCVYRNDVIEDGIIKESFYEELVSKALTQDEIDKFESEKMLNYIKENVK